jgi:serine/threonine-protein kinase HipA
MMTFERKPTEAYVWIWLPGQTKPVVAGRLSKSENRLLFNYGQSYLARENAIAIYDPELPLRRGVLPLTPGLTMPSCLRDAAPDAWGRRVIMNHKFGRANRGIDAGDIDELTYLLESGSDRIGALDFQQSAKTFVAREATAASLNELQNATALVEQGIPLTPELEGALLHGSSIGGARPKSMIVAHDKKYIAKFSSHTDLYNIVKAEFIAMRLAEKVGITAAKVTLEQTAGKDVVLIERFDREKVSDGWHRRAMVSALTLLQLDEMMARYASYEDLATMIRHRFTEPKNNLKQLYARLIFNILCGNTDDHARNHAAFWNGAELSLTPAYDICPQQRTVGEVGQAMLIMGKENASQLALCLKAAPLFLIDNEDAAKMITHQVTTIKNSWAEVCNQARLSEVDRNFMWRRQFLNPYAFVDAPKAIAELADFHVAQ